MNYERLLKLQNEAHQPFPRRVSNEVHGLFGSFGGVGSAVKTPSKWPLVRTDQAQGWPDAGSDSGRNQNTWVNS